MTAHAAAVLVLLVVGVGFAVPGIALMIAGFLYGRGAGSASSRRAAAEAMLAAGFVLLLAGAAALRVMGTVP